MSPDHSHIQPLVPGRDRKGCGLAEQEGPCQDWVGTVFGLWTRISLDTVVSRLLSMASSQRSHSCDRILGPLSPPPTPRVGPCSSGCQEASCQLPLKSSRALKPADHLHILRPPRTHSVPIWPSSTSKTFCLPSPCRPLRGGARQNS
jgi:hypothetical protein